ncbi:EscI/YscI/HrpB family type III secretion system inner rod protein [Endozoicomonas sp. ONNA2]|uniref:EscI/YscI/HrpB family type III secretion system inner rod protein n=1 Tax=Endozoicomonas sp. ONNA2 TaxID=2828741 RepID=UPI0021491927|nr:EscI/YscI/HrpB family type III secretion system inner rod protein [Endozoicomonas sp. ONNA2]
MANNIIKTGDLADKALEKTQEGFANPDQPEAGAAGRFAELVGQKPDENIQVANINPIEVSANRDAPALTLGDKVLQGMQGLRDHVESRADLVKQHLVPGEAMGMQDMFRTQMAMTNLMITEDYIGKIVSKSTQTFDTLLRNQ